jgi:hypothetical protein
MTRVTLERLRGLVSYDPDTGLFKRLTKNRGPKLSSLGDIAGTKHPNGHTYVTVDGRKYSASRLAWFYITGEWPNGIVDHRDWDTSNNRFNNLRVASPSQSSSYRRKVPRRKGPDLPRGVFVARRRFMAKIRVNRKERYLGTFDTPEEAQAAYLETARALFGEFAVNDEPRNDE